MTQLTIEQLIKIILGVLVIVAVAAGIYLIFKTQIIDFFKNLSVETPSGVFMALIK
jgi:hypothetical protein